MPREQGGTSYGSLRQEFLPKFAETFLIGGGASIVQTIGKRRMPLHQDSTKVS